MQKRFGVVGVTAIGMFGLGPMWLVPLTGATVTVAVGAIVRRLGLIDGGLQEREHLRRRYCRWVRRSEGNPDCDNNKRPPYAIKLSREPFQNSNLLVNLLFSADMWHNKSAAGSYSALDYHVIQIWVLVQL